MENVTSFMTQKVIWQNEVVGGRWHFALLRLGGALWSEFPKNVQKFRNHEKSQVNKMS